MDQKVGLLQNDVAETRALSGAHTPTNEILPHRHTV